MGPMRFNPGALLVLVGFLALVAMAGASSGGAWFHAGEALSTVLIAVGLAGLLARGRIRQR